MNLALNNLQRVICHKTQTNKQTNNVGCLVVWVLWHFNLCRLFNTKSIFMKIVIFQIIQFSISTQFKCKYSLTGKIFLFQAIQFSQVVLSQLIQFSISTDFLYTQLNAKTVLYYTIQWICHKITKPSQTKTIIFDDHCLFFFIYLFCGGTC